VIACVARDGREVARGLTNYSSAERADHRKPASRSNGAGLHARAELIHRDNLVLV
jgi:glutamate 5-kinase